MSSVNFRNESLTFFYKQKMSIIHQYIMKQMIISQTPTLLVSPQALQQSTLSHSYKEVM